MSVFGSYGLVPPWGPGQSRMITLQAPSAQECGAQGAGEVLAMCPSKYLRENQIIRLNTLNIHNIICQLYLDKARKKTPKGSAHKVVVFGKALPGS